MSGKVVLSCRMAANGGSVLLVGKAVSHGVDPPSLATFYGGFRCESIPHGLLVKMVPSIHDKNARIVGTYFCTNW